MRTLLAILALVLAIANVVLGVRPLVAGAQPLAELDVATLTSLEAGRAVAVRGGRLRLHPRQGGHLSGDEAFVPLVDTTGETRAVVRLGVHALRGVVAANAVAPGDLDLGPFEALGVSEPTARWPAEVRSFLERELGLSLGDVVGLEHGAAPRGRAFGAVALALGTLLGVVGWTLLRSRPSRSRSDGASSDRTSPASASCAAALAKPLVAAGALALVVASRCGDDLGRRADDLTRSADDLTRSADDLTRSADDLARRADDTGDLARLAPSEDERLGGALDLVDRLLTADEIHGLARFLHEVFAADVVVHSTVALVDAVERYDRIGDDRWELVSRTVLRRTWAARDGALQPTREEREEEASARNDADHVRFTMEALPEDAAHTAGGAAQRGRLVFDVATELLEGAPVRFEAPLEFELGAFTPSDEAPGAIESELRYLPESRARFEAALARATESALESKAAAARASLGRLDATVRVLRLAEPTWFLAAGDCELRYRGPTVIETIVCGWR